MEKEFKTPKTSTEKAISKYTEDSLGYVNSRVKMSLALIVAQLESCDYENEVGTLKTNVAFVALKQLSE